MVTMVVTSCGRLDLLKKTMDSFRHYNTYPISEYIIVDDSGKTEVHKIIKELYPDYTLIMEPENRGQTTCIDDAYSRVKTPYIFHCEDDWEFFKEGFIEPSLEILERESYIMQVWLLDGNLHPIEPEAFRAGDVEYRLLGHDHNMWWHGFTFNPGLRRLSDYLLIAPFSGIEAPSDPARECLIGQEFYRLGFRAAILNDEYCRHIGGQFTTK